jgi:hypothetical protein
VSSLPITRRGDPGVFANAGAFLRAVEQPRDEHARAEVVAPEKARVGDVAPSGTPVPDGVFAEQRDAHVPGLDRERDEVVARAREHHRHAGQHGVILVRDAAIGVVHRAPHQRHEVCDLEHRVVTLHPAGHRGVHLVERVLDVRADQVLLRRLNRAIPRHRNNLRDS